MTNTTTTYWSADGVSLQTLAQNIETLGGTRSSPAAFRGDDVTIPGKPGVMWMPKDVDSKVIELAMWVRGCTPDGTIPRDGGDQRNLYDDNLRALQHLLHTPGRRFNLTKRFNIGGVLHSASALAEFSGGFEPGMLSRTGAQFSVDLKIAGGYFYDDTPTQMTLATGDNNFNLTTDGPTQNILITISGGRNNVVVRNKTRSVQVQYTKPTSAGDKVEIDVANYLSTTTPNGAPAYDSSVDILHAGATEWLSLQDGVNVINLSSDSGVSSVILQARGAYH